MCRWLAYTGGPVSIADVLFTDKNSLIDQSIRSRSAETPTNADGFGVGWYAYRETPGLYRSIRPAWNDFNLRDIASQVESHLFMAHVRATSAATVQETNCHPFRHGKWLFVHNGEIFEIEKMRRELLFKVAPELFNCVQGSTDSELMFYLALTLGLEADPIGALERMAGLVEATGRKVGVKECLWMTLGVTDGKSLYAVRYASDRHAPTLYHSRDLADVLKANPGMRKDLSPKTRMVVSEPMLKAAELWLEVPQNTVLRFCDGQMDSKPFEPIAV
jgi:glutamine amidotransferase